MEINEATGEVTVLLGGKSFVLHATMPRVAALQAAVDATGLGRLQAMIEVGDARAIYHGLRCLCASGNEKQLDGMLLGSVLSDAGVALFAALVAGMPKAAKRGNAAAPRGTRQSPGGATGSSPTASSDGLRKPSERRPSAT